MKKTVILCMILCITVSLCGCSRQKTAAEILDDLILSLSLPAGERYEAGTPEGEPAFLSDDLRHTLYGDGDGDYLIPRLEDYAILLSAHTQPSEVAVFLCRTRSDTKAVRQMALCRADTLGALFRDAEGGRAESSVRIYERGRVIILLATTCPEEALAAARRATRP